jgi:SecD/SecF fusion protein
MFWLLAQQTEESAKVPASSGWMIFWMLLAVIFVPYIVGSLLAKGLKLKDYSSRMGTVLFCLTAALTPFCFQLAQGQKIADCFRLGIDLAGGTNLVYQVDRDNIDPEKDFDRSMDNMVGAIIRRVNPSGTEEVTVRRVGSDRIEVIIPGADQAYVEEMKNRMTQLGTLEFEILATQQDKWGEHQALIVEANKLTDNETRIVMDGVEVARWVEVEESERITNGGSVLPAETREVKRGDETIQQALVAITPQREEVTGEFLVRATEQMDPSGRLVVGFRFNQTGAARFFELTSKYKPLQDDSTYRLAVLLDGIIESAPSLNGAIGAQGQIEGNFTRTEIRSLVSVLNAGALDIPLNTTPVSEFTISPLLGVDIRQKGVTAIAISAVFVIVFMAVYYLKAGLIAVTCLLFNMLLIMGTMVFVQGTFTLPGLAGLVLTIGMAVDANVLIFERIREEVARGASTRMAIHNGFDKAFSAIIDSNLTTLIVAVVLFMIGTDQVKGFAVTLFIGIVMSMFSALYFGRLVFEVLEQKRLLQTLPMLSIVKSPSHDFVGKQKIAAVVSAVLIVAGMASVIVRAENNLDIDFRGGTMVTFEFDQPQVLDGDNGFRQPLEEEFGSGITIERLTRADESQASEAGRRWRLRTTEQKVEKVQTGIAESLGDRGLKRVEMAPIEVVQIAAAAAEEPGDDNPDEDTETIEEEEEKSAYASGWQSNLAFTKEITANTVSRNLAAAITALPNGAADYPEPSNLFRLSGTAGSGVGAAEGQVQTFTEMLLEVRSDVKQADLEAALNAMRDKMASTPLFEEVSKFSTAVGREMQQQALVAMVISLAAIIIYIWFRFQRITFGFAAVAALVHDVLVVLGVMALASMLSNSPVGSLLMLYDFKINLPMIAAFLTIVGYSLNDTIVIFDRIREVRGKNPALTEDMINRSLNQTLARTILTSLTTFFVVAILYAFGGEGIHGFAFCLLIGVVVGTYSSIFVASPVLLWLMNRTESAAKPA